VVGGYDSALWQFGMDTGARYAVAHGWTDGWWMESCEDEWVNGRMENGWMDGWKDGRMDGWMDGRTDGRINGRTDGWTEGGIDGWMDGLID